MPLVQIDDVLIALSPIACYLCGVSFAVPESMKKKRLEDHRSFWCPNGHEQHFTGETEAQRLRDELAREKHRTEQAEASKAFWRDQHDAKERSLRATKAVVTRTKKKIVAGRCPCCSTKFKDLAVHMRTEHPNYDPEKAAAALEAKTANA